MTERAESRPTKEDWKHLGNLSWIAGGVIGGWVAGPVGAMAGVAAGPLLAAGAAITTERFRQSLRKSENK